MSRWEVQLLDLVLVGKPGPRGSDRRSGKLYWRRSLRRRVRQFLRRAWLVREELP